MEILVFGKPTCAKCRTTKNKLGHLLEKWEVADEVPLTYFNLETVDGMTEGAWRDVLHMPTVILQDGTNELNRWKGEIPNSNELKEIIAGK